MIHAPFKLSLSHLQADHLCDLVKTPFLISLFYSLQCDDIQTFNLLSL